MPRHVDDLDPSHPVQRLKHRLQNLVRGEGDVAVDQRSVLVLQRLHVVRVLPRVAARRHAAFWKLLRLVEAAT